MNDLGNSFKFNNNHTFDGFNKQENKKEEEKDNLSEETAEETINDAPGDAVVNSKGRKILTDWLDAEYTSAFQYKKVNYSPYVSSPIKNVNKSDIDINDPIVVYEFLKKYTNILYDYDCERDIEKAIVDELEQELKKYFNKNSTDGLEEFMDDKFNELKEKYLTIIPQEPIPAEAINRMLFIKKNQNYPMKHT